MLEIGGLISQGRRWQCDPNGPLGPGALFMGLAWTISLLAAPLGIKHPFSPFRIRKLVRHNWIEPVYLRENNYPWQFHLEEAFDDWKRERPQDWGGNCRREEC